MKSDRILRETLEQLPLGELIDKHLELVHENWRLRTRQNAVDQAIGAIENKGILISALGLVLSSVEELHRCLTIGCRRDTKREEEEA